jgi:DNA polymerase III epsilon subunit-like protein
MRLLFFDTETTGLPKSRASPSAGPDNWPHMVSMSWMILDTHTNEIVSTRDYIIRPDDWIIPQESINIHGITNELAILRGRDLRSVVQEFLNEKCDAWIAHNLEFDMGVLVNAVLWDLGLQFPATPQRKFCSMLLSKNICKLPGKYGNYKVPKLKELYFFTFGKMPSEDNLHRSIYDVEILVEIVKHCIPLRTAIGLLTPDVSTVSNGIHTNGTLTLTFK